MYGYKWGGMRQAMAYWRYMVGYDRRMRNDRKIKR
jgi:hypothetical protein